MNGYTLSEKAAALFSFAFVTRNFVVQGSKHGATKNVLLCKIAEKKNTQVCYLL